MTNKQHATKCKTKDINMLSGGIVLSRECDCDGYHTFDELYEHRHRLWVALVETLNYPGLFKTPDRYKGWKSLLNSDGTGYEGYFLLGIGKANGEQISYHLPLKYWEQTNFIKDQHDRAPKWDGHSSDDVLLRLKKLMRHD